MSEIESPITLSIMAKIRDISIRALLITSTIFIVNGYSWIKYQTPGRLTALEFSDIITPAMVGIAWIVIGVFGLVSRVINRRSFYQTQFFLLILCPMSTSAFYFTSWVIYVLPLGDRGFPNALASGVIYLLVGVTLYYLSKVFIFTMGIDPPKKTRRDVE